MAARPYDSAFRRAQAQRTRQRIAEAARELMLESGFAGTTMADVADRAGVAPQTLYAVARGGKPGLARLVYDITLMGNADPAPMHLREPVLSLAADPDPRVKVSGYATLNALVWGRLAPVVRVLRDAAALERTLDGPVRSILAEADQRRLAGARGCAESVASVGGLAPGLGLDRAAQQLFALASEETYHDLTVVSGWTDQEYGEWLGRQMAAAILA